MSNRRHASSVNPDARTILWCSNGPALPTGYGTQTAQVVSRLKSDGHKVAVASNYGTEGMVTSWNGVRVYPRGYTQYSEDVIPRRAHEWATETGDAHPLVIGLFDTWVYGDFTEKVPQVAWWAPIDHMPAPPKVTAFLSRPNVTPIAMSKFGQAMIENAGLECLYVPHAIEPVFAPTPTFNGMTGRELMGVPEDAYCITINQANKAAGLVHRKSWAENLFAAVNVMARRDDVWLYLHTEAAGAMGGFDLSALLSAVDAPKDRVRVVDQAAYSDGIPSAALAAIYTGTDVLLAASMGEGFGLTPLEAQATGTPVIVSNFTAQPELVGDGWCVDGQPFWDAAQRSWWMTPSIRSIEEALEAACAKGRFRSDEAMAFAKAYDADKVFDEFWRPALKVLAP